MKKCISLSYFLRKFRVYLVEFELYSFRVSRAFSSYIQHYYVRHQLLFVRYKIYSYSYDLASKLSLFNIEHRTLHAEPFRCHFHSSVCTRANVKIFTAKVKINMHMRIFFQYYPLKAFKELQPDFSYKIIVD